MAHASRRAVSPFVATCLWGERHPRAGGMPARMPAQHAESVRHLAFVPDISESIGSTRLQDTKRRRPLGSCMLLLSQ